MKFENIIRLLLEAPNKKTKGLFLNSDEQRKERANNVKIISIEKYTPSTTSDDKPLLKGWKRYDFEALSREKTENRKHSGYVVLDGHSSVKDIFCSCADFQFLWRYALTLSDMASWETYPEYEDIETYAPHTQEPSHETNPLFEKKLCKHLLKIFKVLEIDEK